MLREPLLQEWNMADAEDRKPFRTYGTADPSAHTPAQAKAPGWFLRSLDEPTHDTTGTSGTHASPRSQLSSRAMSRLRAAHDYRYRYAPALAPHAAAGGEGKATDTTVSGKPRMASLSAASGRLRGPTRRRGRGMARARAAYEREGPAWRQQSVAAGKAKHTDKAADALPESPLKAVPNPLTQLGAPRTAGVETTLYKQIVDMVDDPHGVYAALRRKARLRVETARKEGRRVATMDRLKAAYL